jgi:hypothetical protein
VTCMCLVANLHLLPRSNDTEVDITAQLFR